MCHWRCQTSQTLDAYGFDLEGKRLSLEPVASIRRLRSPPALEGNFPPSFFYPSEIRGTTDPQVSLTGCILSLRQIWRSTIMPKKTP